MKNILILIYLITIAAYSQNKSGTIVYYAKSVDFKEIKQKMNNDSLVKNNKLAKTILNNFLLKGAKEEAKFELEFNTNQAHYKYLDEMSSDENLIDLNKIIAKSNGDFYFDFKKKVIINKKKFKQKEFFICNSLNSFNWILTNEKKQFGKYTCYKAFGKQKVYFSKTDTYRYFPLIAWYTTSIPISAGPDGVGGLPGLIVELKLKSRTYLMKSIKYDKNIKVKLPSNEKLIKMNEFNKLKRNYVLEN